MDDLDRRFFEWIVYKPDARTYAPVIETYQDEVYVKFMSYGGQTDDEQGLIFRTFLDSHDYKYVSSRLRSYIVADINFVRDLRRVESHASSL